MYIVIQTLTVTNFIAPRAKVRAYCVGAGQKHTVLFPVELQKVVFHGEATRSNTPITERSEESVNQLNLLIPY